jgi:hypothetical protein
LRNEIGVEVAGVGLFQRDDARLALQAGVQLALADIDRVNLGRAAREQDVGEAAGGRADIETDEASGIDAEAIEPLDEFESAARDPGVGASALISAPGGSMSEGLRTGAPLAATRPASMASRALARLSNRPRSTSRRSARVRVMSEPSLRAERSNPGTHVRHESDGGARSNKNNARALWIASLRSQ